MMDFKSYVKTMLESENAKKKRCSDETDEVDETEASCKTGCTGSEASCKTNKKCSDETDDSEDSEEDSEDSEADEEEVQESVRHVRTLKEEMLSTMNYLNGNREYVLSEQEIVLQESIKNNSASKFFNKLAGKTEREAAKYERKGDNQKAKNAKQLAKDFKEASNKLFKAETAYQGGDPTAKREYKEICKQYKTVLKAHSKQVHGTVAKIVAVATVLLGAIGVTTVANPALFSGLENALHGADGKFDKEEFLKFAEKTGKNNLSYIGDLADRASEEGAKLRQKIDDAYGKAKVAANDWYENNTEKGKATKAAREELAAKTRQEAYRRAKVAADTAREMVQKKADDDFIENNAFLKGIKNIGSKAKEGKDAVEYAGKTAAFAGKALKKGFGGK